MVAWSAWWFVSLRMCLVSVSPVHFDAIWLLLLRISQVSLLSFTCVLLNFWTRSQRCEKLILDLSCLSLRLEQLDSQWTVFREI